MAKWINRRLSAPVWALALAALAVAGGVGAAASGDAESAKEAAAASAARADRAEQRAEAEAEKADSADQRARDAEGAAKKEYDAKAQELEKLRVELVAVADDLSRREAVLKAALATGFGDGTYEVGRDIQPGKYRTQGGDGCYWEKRRDDSGSLGSIVDNDNADGPVTVVIAAPVVFFKSSDCGDWIKIG